MGSDVTTSLPHEFGKYFYQCNLSKSCQQQRPAVITDWYIWDLWVMMGMWKLKDFSPQGAFPHCQLLSVPYTVFYT